MADNSAGDQVVSILTDPFDIGQLFGGIGGKWGDTAKGVSALGTLALYLLEPSTWIRFTIGAFGLAAIGTGAYLFVAKN